MQRKLGKERKQGIGAEQGTRRKKKKIIKNESKGKIQVKVEEDDYRHKKSGTKDKEYKRKREKNRYITRIVGTEEK